MMTQQTRHGWQRLVQAFASTRLGAWFGSRVLHHIDKPVYRWSNGRFTATSFLAGLPVITLTTIGAKTGKTRTVPLLAIPDNERIVLIASNWGQSHYPGWYHNLRANPEATVVENGRSAPYRAHEATGAEYGRYWQQAIDLYAGYTNYQQRVGDRHIPIMVLTPQGAS